MAAISACAPARRELERTAPWFSSLSKSFLECTIAETSYSPVATGIRMADSFADEMRASCGAHSSDGGGGRTRTCEVVRRLIYSQLPLPLGTLPRPNSVSNSSARGGGGQNHRYGAGPASPGNGARSGAFMGKRTRKVNQVEPPKRCPKRSKPSEIARIRNP